MTDKKQMATHGNVLLVTSSFPRWQDDATAPFILHIAQDLIELGWQVEVLAPHTEGSKLCEVIGGVPVSRFRYLWPERWQTLCYGGGALINLRSSWRSKLQLLPFLLFEGWAIFNRLRRRRYALVHSHWLLPQGLMCGLAAAALRIPHVGTVHGSDVFALRGSVPSFSRSWRCD